MRQLPRVVLVRHGETVGNSSIRYFGRTDLELSELGRAQMGAARDALITDFHIDHFDQVFTSPLRRAREGAVIIAGSTAEVIQVRAFVEVDFGDFEGLTADEIAVRFPEEFVHWNRDRLAADYTYPGGENRTAFKLRVESGVASILPVLEGENSLIVAHRGVIRVIADCLAGVRPEIELGSIQILVRESDAWRVAFLDFTAHLASCR